LRPRDFSAAAALRSASRFRFAVTTRFGFGAGRFAFGSGFDARLPGASRTGSVTLRPAFFTA
jgi:hypothetical protein